MDGTGVGPGRLLIDAGGEAVTVILLYTLGEALEAYSADRARDSLRSLLARIRASAVERCRPAAAISETALDVKALPRRLLAL